MNCNNAKIQKEHTEKRKLEDEKSTENVNEIWEMQVSNWKLIRDKVVQNKETTSTRSTHERYTGNKFEVKFY